MRYFGGYFNSEFHGDPPDDDYPDEEEIIEDVCEDDIVCTVKEYEQFAEEALEDIKMLNISDKRWRILQLKELIKLIEDVELIEQVKLAIA